MKDGDVLIGDITSSVDLTFYKSFFNIADCELKLTIYYDIIMQNNNYTYFSIIDI